jgi:hypothetical protein
LDDLLQLQSNMTIHFKIRTYVISSPPQHTEPACGGSSIVVEQAAETDLFEAVAYYRREGSPPTASGLSLPPRTRLHNSPRCRAWGDDTRLDTPAPPSARLAGGVRGFDHFERWVTPGGYVAFHDYADYYPGVKTFVNEILNKGHYEKVHCELSMMVLRKRPEVAQPLCVGPAGGNV